jgi:hypothetical protein
VRSMRINHLGGDYDAYMSSDPVIPKDDRIGAPLHPSLQISTFVNVIK